MGNGMWGILQNHQKKDYGNTIWDPINSLVKMDHTHFFILKNVKIKQRQLKENGF